MMDIQKFIQFAHVSEILAKLKRMECEHCNCVLHMFGLVNFQETIFQVSSPVAFPQSLEYHRF